MAERKFTKGLSKPGMAAQLRETVSQVVRETTVQNKPLLVEPIDYETFVLKNKTILQNDPQRELLLYPQDDVTQTSLPKRYRTLVSTVPPQAQDEASSLFVRECLNTYATAWHLILYKYSNYSGTYLQLPKMPKSEELKEQVYEVDAEADHHDEELLSPGNGITKKGYLLKGPEGGNEKIFSNKSFKRRYCYLRQEVDGAYILELYKDEKKGEAKSTIVMDFCTEVVRSTKRGKLSFELRMAEGHKSYVLAAETEIDVVDWIEKLTRVVQLSHCPEEKKSSSLERGTTPPPPLPAGSYGTLRGLEHSLNPQLNRYARETDVSIAQARKESRHRIFAMYPDLPRSVATTPTSASESGVDPYKEQHGVRRFLVRCSSIKFRLQAPMDNGQMCQLEPYITTMSLYDAKQGRKISEDFHFDVNHPYIRNMLPKTARRKSDAGSKECGSHCSVLPKLQEVPEEWLVYPKQAVFSVSCPDPEVYLVVRVEKVLQGAIASATEPYVRAVADPKAGIRVQKVVRNFCQRLGNYRMPFAWTARPIFKPYSMELDTSSDFPAIYRQESNRLSDEDLLKTLSEFRKPDRIGRLTVIPGVVKVHLENVEDMPINSLTPSLVPLQPFPIPPTHEPTLEIQEFLSGTPKDAYPYTTFINHLYVYPHMLKYETQRVFARARNIACVVEMRDSDSEDSQPLKCIYGGPGEPVFVCQATCAVSYHNTSPLWYNEVKVNLPVQLHNQHHLLFTFYHISCEPGKKRESIGVESVVGYAWVPLIVKGRLNVDPQSIPVAAQLPSGYLAVEPLGLGRGFTGPDIRWVDGQKQLFSVSFQLVSTVATKDQHLTNFFAHSEKLLESKAPVPSVSESETSKTLKGASPDSTDTSRELSKYLKALHAVDVATLVSFLPTILNQLFRLLVATASEDVALNVVRILIHIVHSVYDADHGNLLKTYIKYVFVTPRCEDLKGKGSPGTVHEELCKSLTILLRPANMDFLVINKFLHHSGFFFSVVAKSMAQHLLSTGRIKMHRNERFQPDFMFRIQNLVQVLCPYIIQKYKELPTETQEANHSLANFITRCLTFMDRGFVFKLMNFFMDKFNPGDPRLLFEYKFNFLQVVCAHEHYVSLNLPLEPGPKGRGLKEEGVEFVDFGFEYRLSEEFCQHHFLVGLLLQEVRTALNEVSDVRWVAIRTLRDLLAKHEFDDRYQNKGQQARIASLYLPWIWIVLENLNRLNTLGAPPLPPGGGVGGDMGSVSVSTRTSVTTLNSSLSALGTPRAHRYTGNFDYGSPTRSSLPAYRDPAYLALIAAGATGGSQPSLVNGASVSTVSLAESHSSSTISGESSASSQETMVGGGKGKRTSQEIQSQSEFTNGNRRSHSRHHSTSTIATHHPTVLRFDKLQPPEVRDLLLTFLYILKHVSDDLLVGWWQQCSEYDLLDFFRVLEICLHQFKYLGRKQIAAGGSQVRPGGKKAMTLPARMQPPNFSDSRSLSTYSESNSVVVNNSDANALYRALLEANMATEVGLIALDSLGLHCGHFKEALLANQGDNPQMKKVFDIYLSFLQVGQSEALFRHIFAALRAFISNFQAALFQGNAVLCGRLCFELLRCCNNKLSTTRQESCAILYLLMRSNFEFCGRQGLTRVHLQVIISVSQLLGEVIGLNNGRFQESLSLINSYASSDKAMQGTGFPVEVKDLTKRIRTVLMATAQMRDHECDPEMLLDLQHSLACSYAATPELRRTWLESMARHHLKREDYSEAAMCHVHTAALMAEYLKQKGVLHTPGCMAFADVSPNVVEDESCLKLDAGVQDVPYSEQALLEQLEHCVQLVDKAERHELAAPLYAVAIPVYQGRRDYQALAHTHRTLAQAYSRALDAIRSGKRLLGRYYRVALFGQAYFEEESGRQYVYKEPKVTALSEISERLYHQYMEKFGRDTVKMIMDSIPVITADLDPRLAYIQVTHVTPYFSEEELALRPTEFEKNHDVRRFVFETPFTKDGKARGSLEEQCKRRTFLTTERSFPYVKKRILVQSQEETELSPIEVALDEMKSRVIELLEVVNGRPTDLKKLQLKLQGSISVQVNAGPLAYASVFLESSQALRYPSDKVSLLRTAFGEFVCVCREALELNGQMIGGEQVEYHQLMVANLGDLERALAALGVESRPGGSGDDAADGEIKRDSFALFSAISGTPAGVSSA